MSMVARRWVWTREKPKFSGPELVEVPDGFICNLDLKREPVYDRKRGRLPVDFSLERVTFTSMDGCHNSESIAVFVFGYDKAGWLPQSHDAEAEERARMDRWNAGGGRSWAEENGFKR